MTSHTEAEAMRFALECSRLREENDRLTDCMRDAALLLKMGRPALALEKLQEEI